MIAYQVQCFFSLRPLNCARMAGSSISLSASCNLVSPALPCALFVVAADFGVEVPIFNYLRLYLPERVLDKKLKVLLIRADIEKELAYQQQREVELGTELITTPILYSGKFVHSLCMGSIHYDLSKLI